MFYHNTIRRYTLLLLNKFKDLELQYKNSNDDLITKSIPIHYKIQEKEFLLDKSNEQIITGNTNVLPRATLELTSLSPSTDRQVSKFLKINKMISTREGFEGLKEFQWNCVAYEFSYTLSIFCRGMSEVCQIIEEVAPRFNPVVYLDVYDAEDEDSPTRVPVQLSSISFSPSGYDEASINSFEVTFDLLLSGYLFQPKNAYSQIKEFYINLNTNVNKEQMKFDVKDMYPQLQPTVTYFDYSDIKIDIISINKSGRTVTVVYDSNVNPKVKFTVEGCDIVEANNDACIVSTDSGFTITAVLEYGDFKRSITREF